MIEVRGALQFRTRAALDKAVLAFDDNAYPEFFTSSMWTLEGPFAICEATFEIEADCDYDLAFRSLAKTAVEGTIEYRDPHRDGITHLVKMKSGWSRSPAETFGDATTTLIEAWAPKLESARADDAAKAAKAAKKSAAARVVIECGANDVAACSDGSLALAGRRLSFYSTDGALLAEQPLERSLSDLLALPDGRVIGYSHSMSSSVTVATPTTIASIEGPSGFYGTGAAHANGITTYWGIRDATVLGRAEPLPRWTEDFLQRIVAWRDGLLAIASNEVAMLELDGSVRWKVKAYDTLEGPDFIIVSNGDNTASRIAADGTRGATFEIGHVASGPASEGSVRGWFLDGNRLVVANAVPSRLTEWDVATGANRSRMQTHEQMLAGCARVGALTATWCGVPIRGERDTRVVFSRNGAIVDQFDAKGDVLAALPIGDALAVRTKAKLFVWRAGKLTTLGGHKGAIKGFTIASTGELVSWGADGTVRLW